MNYINSKFDYNSLDPKMYKTLISLVYSIERAGGNSDMVLANMMEMKLIDLLNTIAPNNIVFEYRGGRNE